MCFRPRSIFLLTSWLEACIMTLLPAAKEARMHLLPSRRASTLGTPRFRPILRICSVLRVRWWRCHKQIEKNTLQCWSAGSHCGVGLGAVSIQSSTATHIQSRSTKKGLVINTEFWRDAVHARHSQLQIDLNTTEFEGRATSQVVRSIGCSWPCTRRGLHTASCCPLVAPISSLEHVL